MATVLETEITNPRYINFLKTGLGLKEVQRGLAPFITRSLQQIHNSLITNVGGSSCFSCTLETLQLHINCITKGCLCNRNPPNRRPCPTNTCHRLYDEVVKFHRFQTPNFRIAVLWRIYTDPWEFGKCFLPPAGYGTKASAAECDATGLLSIIINCTELTAILGAAISAKPPKDVFSAVKDIRNSIMHASVLEMSDSDTMSALHQMVQVLEHGPQLLNDVDAKAAAAKIVKMKNATFRVTRIMEKDVLEEKFNAIEERRKCDTSKQHEEITKLHDLLDVQQSKITDLEVKVPTLSEKLEKCGDDYESKLKSFEHDIKDDLTSIRQKHLEFEMKLEEHITHCKVNKELLRLIDDTRVRLKQHRRCLNDENLDVDSRLTTSLSSKLKEKNVLVLTGKSGVGKTHQAYNILTMLDETCEYKPVIATNISEVKSILPNDGPFCLLVNDMLGRFSVNKESLDAWNTYIDACVEHVNTGQVIMIITLNSVNLNQCLDEPVYEILEKYCVNLEENGLTKDEKNEMINKLDIKPDSKTRQKLLNETSLPLGLPLLCKLAKGKTDSILTLIENPLKEIIKKMEPSCYVALLMTLFSGETFSDSISDPDENEHMSTYFQKLSGCYKSHNIDMIEVLDKAKSLVGSYLGMSEEGIFCFIHDSVLEATFKSAIASGLLQLLIKYCHMPTLLKLCHNIQPLKESLIDKLLARFETERIPVRLLGSCSLWLNSKFQVTAIEHFKAKMHFFTKPDDTGESMLVPFACLGLNSLLMVVLEREIHCPDRDETTVQQQVRLAALKACSHGQKDCVSLLLKRPNVIVCYEHLFESLRSDNEELFDFLLTKGGTVEARNPSNGRNLIHEACFRNRPGIVKKIVGMMDRNVCKTFLHMQSFDDEYTPLCYAVQTCELDTVILLIQNGSDVEARDDKGNTLLHLALRSGKTCVVNHLLNTLPWMVHQMSFENVTTLHCAAWRGDVECVQTLTDKGIDPMSRTSFQSTLLHLAASNGKQPVIDYLCETYTGILHETDQNGWNAAHSAASRGHLECLQTLIDKGIDPMSRTSDQFTLLHLAAYNGKQPVIDYLCETYTGILHETDKNGCNAAHLAALGGHLECLQTLIDKGIDPMSRTSDQLTLLHLAADNGRQPVIDYLCETYTGILHETDKNGWNAAHGAASKGHLECLQTLIYKGIDPMSRNSDQSTLLHQAASYGKQPVIDYLCDTFTGIIHETDKNGWNAAHSAANEGHLECLQTLIDKGIDPMSRNSDQSTLLHLAASNGKQAVIEYLCETYTGILHETDHNGWNAAHRAAYEGHLECLQTLIDKGIDPMSRTSDQSTLLHPAARNGKQPVIDYLCETYTGILHETDKNGCNAAHLAAYEGHLECLQTLIDKGIDPMSRNSDQSTFLHLAASNGKQPVADYLCETYTGILHETDKNGWNAAHRAALRGHLECLQTLIDKGIDPMSRNSDQTTLLHLAASNGKQPVIDYLCETYTGILHETDKNGWNAAHPAASSGHLECLQTLIDKGIDPMSRTSCQLTLLHLAASNGKQPVIDYLCETYTGILHETDKNGWNAAHSAASRGHLECLQTLIDKGIDPMSRNSEQSTLLHLAAYNGKQPVIDYLCDTYTGMLHETDKNGWNAAHSAAYEGHLECLQTLIDKGIDPMSRASDQATLLHLAADNGKQPVLDYLCETYTGILHETDKDGWNAAHPAASQGHLECLQTLIDKGIDPMSRNSDQSTLLHLAASNGKQPVIDYLCETYTGIIHETDNNGWNAAHSAAYEGHLECLQTLIDKGIDPMSRTSDQSTLLHLAASNGKQPVIDYLCETYTGIIHETDKDGWNAANNAAYKGHLECLQTLIDKGIDPMSRNSDQSTLLHLAASNGKQPVIDYLCATYTGILHETDEDGWNAAHFAAYKGHLECLQTLMDKGIDPMSRTSDQSTLLHLAASNGKQPVIDYLCETYTGILHETDENGWNAAHRAAYEGHLECLQTLIDKGIDPMSQNSDQSTLLHLAASNGKQPVIDYLCETYTGIIHETDNNGWNAAHSAAYEGHLECLQTLIDKGIDPMSRTPDQSTLLHLAADNGKQPVIDYLCETYTGILRETDKNGWNAAHRAASKGHLECLQTLINKGIDPMSRNSDQSTLLHLAASNGKQPVIDYLCETYTGILHETDNNGWNAAHSAANEGHLECLQTLIDKGIDPMSRTSDQSTLLHLAADNGKQPVIDYLCETYTGILHETDKKGRNAAQRAASKGHLECLQTLRDKDLHPMSTTSYK